MPGDEQDKAGVVAPGQRRRLARWVAPDGRTLLVLQEVVWRLATKPPASLILKRQFAAGNTLKL
jgi:hypothetical protein